jgi:hypothetical protein
MVRSDLLSVTNREYRSNHRAGVDAGYVVLFVLGRPWPGPTQHGRDMNARLWLVSMVLIQMMSTGCRRGDSFVVAPRAGSAEALALAPLLWVGMSENKAAQVLTDHDIPCPSIRVGCSHGWGRFGELTNKCSLALFMEPGLFGAGRLKAAYVQSNGVNVAQLPIRGGR